MATESADGPELSVTLPPDLEEWVSQRADALETNREDVLVQLLSAYRAASDLDGTDVSELVSTEELLESDGLDARIDDRIGNELAGSEKDLEKLQRRVDALETEHDENIEDLRNRVLQLRDAVRERAESDHTHPELTQVSDRVEELSSDLDGVGTDVADLSEQLAETEARFDEMESKLDRLARVVVALRKQAGKKHSEAELRLEELRRRANRRGVQEAACDSCSERVQIGLLTEPICPHCELRFEELETSGSLLGRFRTPTLTVESPPALEAGDE